MLNSSLVVRSWPYCGAHRNSRFSSLVLLRCKYTRPYCRVPVYILKLPKKSVRKTVSI